MITNTNELITSVAFDIISITTLWSLVITSQQDFTNFHLFTDRYRNYRISLQSVTKIIAIGTSAFIMSRYYRN